MIELPVALAMLGFLAAVGAFAGIIAGLLGVGGGIVLVGAFYYVFSALGYAGPQLMQICLATSLATIVVTSARSVMAHARHEAVDWQILRSYAPGMVIGAAAGVLTVAGLGSDVLAALFGGLALIVGLYMAFARPEWRLGHVLPGPLTRAIVSPVIGFLSVLMGIGGGGFGVSYLTLFGVPIHRAVATAAGFGMLIAVPAVAGFVFVPIETARPPFTLGAVNLPAFVIVIAMTFLTTPIGARLAHRMNPKPLRRIFAVFLLAVAVNMIGQSL